MIDSRLNSFLSNKLSIFWIGALSFEERCVASLLQLQKQNLVIEEGILLDFETDVTPKKEYLVRKSIHEQQIVEISETFFKNKIVKKSIEAYSFLNFQLFIENIFESNKYDLIIVDISCINKLHTLAFAAAVSNIENSEFIVVYTVPENYRNIDSTRKISGWKDILIAPLKETATLFNEMNSRGIIITGHEADRLIVGLSEIEPTSGLIIISDTPLRPDLRQVSEKNNKRVIQQLANSRFLSWKRKIINFNKIADLNDDIIHEINIAKQQDAPLILFPYGPKPIILCSALNICLHYPESSWFVYPVPSAYDVNYSEGIEQIMWINFSNNEISNVISTSFGIPEPSLINN